MRLPGGEEEEGDYHDGDGDDDGDGQVIPEKWWDGPHDQQFWKSRDQ